MVLVMMERQVVVGSRQHWCLLVVIDLLLQLDMLDYSLVVLFFFMFTAVGEMDCC